jgi:hypothetical protein
MKIFSSLSFGKPPSPHRRIFPPTLASTLFAFVLLITPGCFTMGNFITGMEVEEDGMRESNIYIRKERRRNIHLVALYGDKPLRNFVVEFHFQNEPEKHLFLEIEFDHVFQKWRRPWEYWRSPAFLEKPENNFHPPKLSNSDYWDFRSEWINFTEKLPSGFTLIPNARDYLGENNSAAGHSCYMRYREGVDWARFGRYWYQVPMDIVTSPVQVLFVAIAGPIVVPQVMITRISRWKDYPKTPIIKKPKTWERADVEKVVREYRSIREKYEEEVRQWHAKNET